MILIDSVYNELVCCKIRKLFFIEYKLYLLLSSDIASNVTSAGAQSPDQQSKVITKMSKLS